MVSEAPRAMLPRVRFSAGRKRKTFTRLGCRSELAEESHQITALLIVHLAELDARKLFLHFACASLFKYCTEVLHLSEAAASKRIQAERTTILRTACPTIRFMRTTCD